MFNRKKSKKNQVQVQSPVQNQSKANNKANNKANSKANSVKPKKGSKLDMYDIIFANLFAGNSIIEPDRELDRTHIDIGFSNIASEKYIIKYFLITSLPDWLDFQLFDHIRRNVMLPGIRINFYTYGEPYRINWESSEMKNRLRIWGEYTKEDKDKDLSGLNYRSRRKDLLAKERILESTMYLNKAELDYRRRLIKTSFMIEIACLRDKESLDNMDDSINALKRYCSEKEIKLLELRVNMIDWLQQLWIFSLRSIKEVYRRVSKKILTDDIVANFSSYKQGRLGEEGTPLGLDVNSGALVLKKFKPDPDAAENILISGGTGSGKSLMTKYLLTWLSIDNVITVIDYDDEYKNLANFIYDGNPKDAITISMGKGSTSYFDPMEIGELTGDKDIDASLKDNAIKCTMSTFNLMIAGVDRQLDMWEESVISTAVRNVYENNGVTDDNTTWHLSQGCKLADVYEELSLLVMRQAFVDENMDNVKHKAAVNALEACKKFFEEGEAYYGTFKSPINIKDIRDGRFIVFSFSSTSTANQENPVLIGLRQLSVAYITTLISNYCKYVRHSFNVKVWEEYNRFGLVKGSSEIIGDAITGGRKRGDINLIITNDLSNILDENNPISAKLEQNFTGYIIGSIPSDNIREKFCNKFNIPEMIEPLKRIYKANSEQGRHGRGKESQYKHAFCTIMLETGEKAIIKASLPKEVLDSKLFRTGVEKG